MSLSEVQISLTAVSADDVDLESRFVAAQAARVRVKNGGRRLWVDLEPDDPTPDIFELMRPLVPALESMAKLADVYADLVIWLFPDETTPGFHIGRRDLSEMASLLRKIWVESEARTTYYVGELPDPGESEVVDEIVIRSDGEVFRRITTNNAKERQEKVDLALSELLDRAGNSIEFELVPRWGKAGLIIRSSWLERFAEAEIDFKVSSRG